MSPFLLVSDGHERLNLQHCLLHRTISSSASSALSIAYVASCKSFAVGAFVVVFYEIILPHTAGAQWLFQDSIPIGQKILHKQRILRIEVLVNGIGRSRGTWVAEMHRDDGQQEATNKPRLVHDDRDVEAKETVGFRQNQLESDAAAKAVLLDT